MLIAEKKYHTVRKIMNNKVRLNDFRDFIQRFNFCTLNGVFGIWRLGILFSF